MRPPRVAITGTGRSGTAYMRDVLVACGVNAGHEYWFNPSGSRTPDLDVDVSWLVPPFVETGAWSGPVVHVVRHPVATVRALVGAWFLTAPSSNWAKFARHHESDIVNLSPVEQAVEWWVRWNDRIQRLDPVLTFQLENLPGHLGDLGEVVSGYPLSHDEVRNVPRSHHGRRASTSPDTIWKLLDGRAARYGYEEPR